MRLVVLSILVSSDGVVESHTRAEDECSYVSHSEDNSLGGSVDRSDRGTGCDRDYIGTLPHSAQNMTVIQVLEDRCAGVGTRRGRIAITGNVDCHCTANETASLIVVVVLLEIP